jgi:exosortase
LASLGALGAAFAWAYWPTLQATVDVWGRNADYSHGYLVVPIALAFLWLRREEFPAAELSPSLWGLSLIALAVAIRAVAGLYFMAPLDGWTIPLWIGGAVWLCGGWPLLRWSWPAVVFLWFMMPIPYSAERMASVPLQAIATQLSTACLLMLGQPAIAEGNTIWLGDQQMFVEEACSGMRIFVGIFALAFAFVLFSRWQWWQKALVLLAALPIALLGNMCRIVGTGLLYQYTTGETARKFSHDLSGLVMIPLAALLFWLFLLYLDKLFPEVEEIAPLSARGPRPAGGSV